ncbi:OTU-like cysteine protease [Rhizoctonia solani]|uniref:OTU-like cysteine protease n=1 Tax=Rhizoctonia solani TaxID=456999 RepID=A0A8H8PAH1_9AGAM|nr:OTU-like cysteine protease [Rhizoctonia solani]QRW27540.1 OTU-like cysteine protease [Rhizoctonia solani]
MVEIPPDGHCLYTAVADQLALLGLIPSSAVHPSTTRNAAADYMLAHPDSFIPFLPSIEGEDGAGAESAGLLSPNSFTYCARIRDTGTWGGEPEITALANAYKVPIHVVQSGPQRVVVHGPQDGQVVKPDAAVKISYHRRMYGLGEHYNSLRPKTIVDRIPGMEQVRAALKA